MKGEVLELHAVIHEEEDGSFWAEVQELPGCFASGRTLDEVKEGLLEAISFCADDLPIEQPVAPAAFHATGLTLATAK
jgi:predicted RNase H-like HicB family nuclease